ncbi:GNAT family N-acetyltransferase [Nocardia abscessus]|uniref:GNAT family N-acetyltransferase n=1 Tax=Nocardia abscessus TaxID=120957 RepID=UPI001894E81D|nr:GNAT family N-acetyltransferase [Nocardia abscessus]MBF6339796.1 GNAT family N-acetyltransferase [Nocardia abscessus]
MSPAPKTTTVLDTVRLRPLRESDEQVVRAAHEAMANSDEFTFALGLTPAMPWELYLSVLKDYRQGINLPGGTVAATYLVATVDDQVVGRTSIRHTLNDALRRRGGHIGYGVLAPFRRRGYGTAILRHSLTVARAIGIDRILITCDDANLASRRIIESCGGVLESVEPWTDGSQIRRYWID